MCELIIRESKSGPVVVGTTNKNLTNVSIPEGVTIIGDSAFENCVYLGHVDIPDSVKVIRRGAFYGCTSLKDIELPNNIELIDEWAFLGCPFENTLYLPNLQVVGKDAFSSGVGNGNEDAFKNELPSFIEILGELDRIPENRCFIISDKLLNRYGKDGLAQRGFNGNVNVLKSSNSQENAGILSVSEEMKESVSYEFEVNGNAIKVVFDPRTGLEQISETMQSALVGNTQAVRLLYASTVVFSDKMDPLEDMSSQEILEAYSGFIRVCNLYKNPKLLQTVAEKMPKRKDGKLAKGRTIQLASSKVAVFRGLPDLDVKELYAKSVSEDEIEIRILDKECLGNLYQGNWLLLSCEKILKAQIVSD